MDEILLLHERQIVDRCSHVQLLASNPSYARLLGVPSGKDAAPR